MQDPQTSVVFDAYPKVSLQEFVPELAFEFNEMPSDAFPHFLLRAINRFARNSNALRRTATIFAQSCVENYLLEPQDCMDIVAVLSVCQTSHCICSSPVVRVTSEPCRLPCGTYSWFEEPNVIHFSPVKCKDVFKVTMSVAPTYDACEVDSVLLTTFYDVIMDGTKFYLYSMASKPWSSVNRAQESEARFIQGIRTASVQAMMNGQRGALRAKRPRVL